MDFVLSKNSVKCAVFKISDVQISFLIDSCNDGVKTKKSLRLV